MRVEIPRSLATESSGRLVRTTRDFTVLVDGIAYTVRSGFEYDGMSIPRIVWTLVGVTPHGLGREAGAFHDHAYQFNGRFTRSQADSIFREILVEVGVTPWRAWVMYFGVRVGGWLPYWRYRVAGQSGTQESASSVPVRTVAKFLFRQALSAFRRK